MWVVKFGFKKILQFLTGDAGYHRFTYITTTKRVYVCFSLVLWYTEICRGQLKYESIVFGFCISNPSVRINIRICHTISPTKLKTIDFCLNFKGMYHDFYLAHYTQHQIGRNVQVRFHVYSIWT